MIKALVCGGRDFHGRGWIIRVLDTINPDVVIQGGAFGADLIAKEWALSRFKACWTFQADWDNYGKAAGPIRNKQMLEWGQPNVVLAFPGGRGTANMVKLAKAAGIDVLEYAHETDSKHE
jgi:YspA, cpYpsA-related SLOG family